MNLNFLHWCWMAPVAFLLSPFGTVIFTTLLELNAIQCCCLILTQLIIYCLVGVISNFGE